MAEGMVADGSTAVRDVRDDSPDVIAKREERKFQYPGIPTTCDGSEAVVHVEVNVTQASGAFPITSSTNMGGGYNAAVMNGYKNLWGDTLVFVEPESEHSAATFCEGFAASGGRVTNFTSGQGLVLMKEVLYTIAGKRLPVVMNIGARALTSHSLNVHAGHDDMMSVADCGWGMLFGRNAQEAGDLCLISRRAAEASNTPFFNVQDGFLTTHRRAGPPARTRFHEGVHRQARRQAGQPDGPGQPDDVGRGAEPGLVHEGQDCPAVVLRPRRSRSRRRLPRVHGKDRPQVRLRDAAPLRGRRVHHRRHGLLHGDLPGSGRLPPREERHSR